MGLVLAVRSVVTRAEPILRARIIQTLSARFNGKVELASFSVLVGNGIQVSGKGLKIFGATDPNPYEPGVQALIDIGEFRFRTALRSLFRSPMHIDTVYVKGMELNIPPKGNRQEIARLSSKNRYMSIFVDKFVCEDTKLLINTATPGKPPLEFAIRDLKMQDIGPGMPLKFNATLVNPKPVGDIQSDGLFGPLQQNAPGDTPVQGNYSFSNADLSTIRGIGGILSSTGDYSGTLGNIVVHGTTDTPDFQVESSGHPVPLHTEFHAVVDGTSGNTYLQPVNATFLHSSFTARGSVVRVKPHGHEIELNVVLGRARIEDLLRLGVRTEPPVMNGPVEMNTRLSLSPGVATVAERLKLAGNFHVLRTFFTNQKVQGKLDSMSLISQGKPKLAREHIEEENVATDLQGAFTLKDGLLSFSELHFLIPGTTVDMTGVYSLDGRTFDFHGRARLQAKLSQMTTGWKSILLKPVDPFFSKGGAGTEVPIKITGTQSEPHFGLDFRHKDKPETAAKKTDTLSKR
jgi:hypothetical protein